MLGREPESSIHRALASCLLLLLSLPPKAHFSLSGPCSLSCTRPGLHHSWLCLQSSRWRSGPPHTHPWPPFPLISCSLLGIPPPSSLLRPLALGDCLPYLVTLSSLSTPAPQGALEAAEAKRRRLGAGVSTGWKPPFSSVPPPS